MSNATYNEIARSAQATNNAIKARGKRRGKWMYFFGTDGTRVFRVVQRAHGGLWVKGHGVELFATWSEAVQF